MMESLKSFDEILKELYEKYGINKEMLNKIIDYYKEEEEPINFLVEKWRQSIKDVTATMCRFYGRIDNLHGNIGIKIMDRKEENKDVSKLITEYYYWDTIKGILDEIHDLKDDLITRLERLQTLEKRLISLLKVKIGDDEK